MDDAGHPHLKTEVETDVTAVRFTLAHARPTLSNALGKVCTIPVATRADARGFRWRHLNADPGCSRADLRPIAGPVGRTYPRASFKSVRRTIHRLESANSVCNCAVFLASPR